MSLKEEIYQLLSKYEAGETLSNKERLQLTHFMEDEEYAEYLNAYYYSGWNEESSKDFNNQQIFDNIISEIKQGDKNNIIDLSQINKTKQKHNIFAQVLKYAAILVIGVILSTVYNTQFKKKNITGNERFSTVEVEYGSKSKIILPDGTSVWLNSGSKITYPEKFAVNSRKINLTGEAFFDVVRDESRPFFVNTKDINIKVLGTTFNVKSYDDENTVETTLISGKVELKRKNSSETNFIQLKPNQMAVFYKSEKTVEIKSPADKREDVAPILKRETIEIDAVEEPQLITSWKDGKLKFDTELFGVLAQKMERWFDVKITFKNEAAKSIRYSGSFDDESIDQAMHALQLSYPIRYEIKKNEVYIY